MGKNQSQWSRREFFASAAAASAALMLNPFSAWAIDDISPEVAELVASMGIDAHNHIDVPLDAANIPGPALDLKEEMKRSGLSAICMTFAVDYQKLINPGEAYERFKNGMTAMDQQLISNEMTRCLNMADIRTAHNKRQPTVIQSVEGGHFLEGNIERLEEAYKRGLRHLTLLHDNDASTPLGDVFTSEPKFGGLTGFGEQVITECNRLGILVDLSHANQQTLETAIKVSTKPVIVSHTGLDTQLGTNESMANMMKPRLISSEQARMVANAGGVIGVWAHLTETPLAYAQNIRAMIEVVGADNVCIGTDTKLTPAYHAPGEKGGRRERKEEGRRVGERTNNAWKDQKEGFYYAVVEAMLKAGISADEIKKVGSGNFCRVFEAATGG